ncbi:MAG: FxLYD domain-containing protein [Chloroflexota bacterium]|nr:FxLYD domain-containing protein [Chloroflexota bacterium]MDQ5867697.1 FxLYD domain-containing protein [Chloroflexota bacterium]
MRLGTLLWLMVVALLLVGCGGSEVAPTPTAIPTETPDVVATEEAQADAAATAEVRAQRAVETRQARADEANENSTSTAEARAARTSTAEVRRAVAAATSEARAQATQTSVAEESASIWEISDPDFYEAQYSDSLYAVGSIKYTGSTVRSDPEIIITLTDDAGKILSTGEAVYAPEYVVPNSDVPYLVVLDDAPQDFALWELTVEAERITDFDLSFMSMDLVVDTESVTIVYPKESYENLKLIGRVKNTGDKPVSLVSILGALYDKDGKVLDVNTTYAKRDEIEPGGDSTFELSFGREGITERVDKYQLFSSGWPQD